MKYHKIFLLFSALSFASNGWAADAPEKPKIVHFPSGDRTLGGELFLPEGEGPFPVVLYNHGSAPKMINSLASAAIGPEFVKNGWAFFMPYRRGQGLSEAQGPYVMDEINSAKRNGFSKAAKKLVALNRGDHLNDQMAALAWLRKQPFADTNRIATAGNSFGGIQVMLGMQKAEYCAGINAAGAAQSWDKSDDLQKLLKGAAVSSQGPIFFFQADNDYDITPSKKLFTAMTEAGKQAEIEIYPQFGSSKKEGHSFPYRGVSVWFDDALSFVNKHCVDQQFKKADTPDL